MMRRLLCAGLVLFASATAALAQFQQRPDEPGITTGGLIQQTTPLPIPPTQSPVITNPALPTQQQIQQLQQLQQVHRPQQVQPAARPAAQPPAPEPNELHEFITASTG